MKLESFPIADGETHEHVFARLGFTEYGGFLNFGHKGMFACKHKRKWISCCVFVGGSKFVFIGDEGPHVLVCWDETVKASCWQEAYQWFCERDADIGVRAARAGWPKEGDDTAYAKKHLAECQYRQRLVLAARERWN